LREEPCERRAKGVRRHWINISGACPPHAGTDVRDRVRRPSHAVTPTASVNSVNTYSGPARLILADGTRVSGTASLKMNRPGGPPGWGGTFRPDVATDDTRAAVNDLQIELPYEQIGHVAVTGTRRLLATQILMSLAGRGPAPF
jgi:hypothetical protein